MSFDCNGKKSFHSHLMNKSEYFNLPDFNPDLLDTAMVTRYVSSSKQEYISHIGKTPFNIIKNLNFIDLLKPPQIT